MVSPQSPIHSGFDETSTATGVIRNIDLRGMTAIVTGGYSGIGLHTTRALSNAGAEVFVPARTPEKARAALTGIPRVTQVPMDLLVPATIDEFVSSFLRHGAPLHLLVNSAGIMAAPLARDSRGYESHFSANHLGHFQLTARLLPALRRARGARVVAVSSRGHRISDLDFDDPNFERRVYDRWKAYGQSKTANVLFALALDTRGEAEGVRAFSVHPGRILETDLARHMTTDDLNAMGVLDENGRIKQDAGLKTAEQGAATSVWCATSPQLDGMGGVYCEECDIGRVVAGDSAEPSGVRPWAIDPEAAERLWRMSEQLTGIRSSF